MSNNEMSDYELLRWILRNLLNEEQLSVTPPFSQSTLRDQARGFAGQNNRGDLENEILEIRRQNRLLKVNLRGLQRKLRTLKEFNYGGLGTKRVRFSDAKQGLRLNVTLDPDPGPGEHTGRIESAEWEG